MAATVRAGPNRPETWNPILVSHAGGKDPRAASFASDVWGPYPRAVCDLTLAPVGIVDGSLT